MTLTGRRAGAVLAVLSAALLAWTAGVRAADPVRQYVDEITAATITVAVERAMPLATDDRKARRLCADLQVPEPMRTLGILHAYVQATHLPHAELRDILIRIRDRASYQPPRNDPDRKWWEEMIDDG